MSAFDIVWVRFACCVATLPRITPSIVTANVTVITTVSHRHYMRNNL